MQIFLCLLQNSMSMLFPDPALITPLADIGVDSLMMQCCALAVDILPEIAVTNHLLLKSNVWVPNLD